MIKLQNKQSEDGFSLVEIAIVMVIIGVIMAAVAIGKDTKATADATQLFKKRVESCVAVAYGVGDYTKYDGSAITNDSKINGKSLKDFCKVIRKNDGTMEATIYAPSKKAAVILQKKSAEKLSPDDFTVQSAETTNRHFTVTVN